jgi:hypothetical protein
MSAYRGAIAPELGPLIEEARPSRWPLTALTALFVFVAVIIDASALASPPNNIERWMTVILFGIAVPALVLFARFGRQPDSIRIHQLGFVARNHAVRWDELVELRTKRFIGGRNGTYRSVLDRHRLRLRNGEQLDLRFAFANNDAVLDHMRERTREPLLRETTLPAKFGAITVDEQGVRTEFASLNWSQIDRAGFDGPLANVVVRGPGSAWIELPLDEVPNAHVLCAIVNQRAAAGGS